MRQAICDNCYDMIEEHIITGGSQAGSGIQLKMAVWWHIGRGYYCVPDWQHTDEHNNCGAEPIPGSIIEG